MRTLPYRAVLRSIEPEQNRFREFVVEAAAVDDGFRLNTWRGRIGAILRPRHETHGTIESLADQLGQVLRKRIVHGYLFVE